MTVTVSAYSFTTLYDCMKMLSMHQSNVYTQYLVYQTRIPLRFIDNCKLLNWISMHAVTHKIAIVSKTTNVTYSPLQWSYGVTCWELFTGGKIPYPGVDPVSLSGLLESGHRLDKPKNAACSEEMYDNPTPSCTADTHEHNTCMQAYSLHMHIKVDLELFYGHSLFAPSQSMELLYRQVYFGSFLHQEIVYYILMYIYSSIIISSV